MNISITANDTSYEIKAQTTLPDFIKSLNLLGVVKRVILVYIRHTPILPRDKQQARTVKRKKDRNAEKDQQPSLARYGRG